MKALTGYQQTKNFLAKPLYLLVARNMLLTSTSDA